MCLNTLSLKQTKNYKRRVKPITAYKILGEEFFCYFAPFVTSQCYEFKIGENRDDFSKILECASIASTDKYETGFHSFLSLEEAKKALWDDYRFAFKTIVIIEVTIPPQSVIAVGEQDGYKAIVSKILNIKSFTHL